MLSKGIKQSSYGDISWFRTEEYHFLLDVDVGVSDFMQVSGIVTYIANTTERISRNKRDAERDNKGKKNDSKKEIDVSQRRSFLPYCLYPNSVSTIYKQRSCKASKERNSVISIY